jgi:transposase
MDEPTCKGCRQRDARIAVLEQQVAELLTRVRDLEARLGPNASNSSIPPSVNPPQAPAPVQKQPTGRKPGGQPGHIPHLRLRLPPERLTEPTVHYRPQTCAACQYHLPLTSAADDPEPTWHQAARSPGPRFPTPSAATAAARG